MSGDPGVWLRSLVYKIPVALLTLYTLGLALGLASQRMRGFRQRVDWKLSSYLDTLGLLAYLFCPVGWYRLDAFEDPRLQSAPRQLKLHLAALCAALVLTCATMLISFSVSGFQGNLETLFREVMLYCMIFPLMTALWLIVPLYPAPGWRILHAFLSHKAAFRMTQYRSVTAVIVVAALFLGDAVLILPVLSLIGVMGATGYPGLILILLMALAGLFVLCRPIKASFVE